MLLKLPNENHEAQLSQNLIRTLLLYLHSCRDLQQFPVLIFVHFVEKNLFTLPFSSQFRGASKAFTFYKRRQILKIEESVPTDNGNYSCLVSNRHGHVQRFFTGKYFYTKFYIHSFFKSNTVNEGLVAHFQNFVVVV